MALKEALVAATLGAAIYDWVVVTRAANLMLSDYKYLPFARRRKISIILLSAGAFISFAVMGPMGSNNPFWMLLPVFIGMGLHGWLAFSELLDRYWLEQDQLNGS